MDIRKNLLRAISAAALTAALGASAVPLASAAQTEMSDYARYYAAIRAYELCNDVEFDQAQYRAMTDVIVERTSTNLSVGESLATIEDAEAKAWDMVFKQRCDSQEVGSLLALFESDLSPAVQ